MGMPALVYRWYFRAHSVKSLERNILGFVGIAPVHETLIGDGRGHGCARACSAGWTNCGGWAATRADVPPMRDAFTGHWPR